MLKYRCITTVVTCLYIIFKVLLFYHIFCQKVQCVAHVANSNSILNIHRQVVLNGPMLTVYIYVNYRNPKEANYIQELYQHFYQRLYLEFCPLFHFTLWYYKRIFQLYILMPWIRNIHTNSSFTGIILGNSTNLYI